MFHLKKRESKRGVHLPVKHHKIFGHDVKEIFVGYKTILALIGFTVGSIMVGRTLWEYSFISVGLHWTLAIGLVIFILSGLALGRFHK